MSEEEKPVKNSKKWISYTIDALLIAMIAFLAYVQISMIVTKPKNHGVPMVFGSSFLYVSTDSMDDPDNPDCLAPGTGIIIHSVGSYDELKTSNPILDEGGNPTGDYDKTGDIVTFYYATIRNVDTHRLIEKTYDETEGKWHFKTMGDNPVAHQRGAYKTESWTQDDLVGKVTFSSKALGTFLTLTSPDAAASAGKTAWLLPTAIIVPLVALAGMSIVDVYRTARKKEKEEEREINEAMIAAGIDPNDEVAAETFRQKEEFKREYKMKMDEEVAAAKKQYQDVLEKEKKRALKEAQKNQKKGSEQ